MAWMHELIEQAREEIRVKGLGDPWHHVSRQKLERIVDLLLDEVQRLRELINDTRDNCEWRKNQ